ncbi:AzlC family ABC transporter permease [Saccharibacillus sp. CPCC 101409]|nr:AzlC family ABC transporter permease [Saccharibacillus sp. CPCC 101409]
MDRTAETRTGASLWKESFYAAFPRTLPILPSLIALAVTYGVLMTASGFGWIWTVLMSAVAFCGTAQFAAIPLMLGGFAPVQGFILSFLINSRHLFYGIPLLDTFKKAGKLRPFMIFALNDEAFAISCSTEPDPRISRVHYHFWVTMLTYTGWVGGTMLGAAAGRLITGNVAGLDFAMTALFIVMFLEQIRKKEKIKFAGIGLCCSIVALLIVGSAAYMIPAMAIMVVCLLGGRGRKWI